MDDSCLNSGEKIQKVVMRETHLVTIVVLASLSCYRTLMLVSQPVTDVDGL